MADASQAQRRRELVLRVRSRISEIKAKQGDDWRCFVLDRLDARKAEADLEAEIEYILSANTYDTKELYGEKYLDFAKRTFASASFLKPLGLDTIASSQRILDLGAGAGFFCFAAAAYGHQTVALQPGTLPGQTDKVSLDAIIRLLGVPHSEQSLQPQVRIVHDAVISRYARFDWVTAFAIMLNHSHATVGEARSYWSKDDYLFFLNDLRMQLLTEDGRVFLLFNEQIFGEPNSLFTAPSLIRYYYQLGQLLSPFIVSHQRNVGTKLSLRNASAWRAAEALRLDPPDPEEVRYENLVAVRNAEREAAALAKRGAAKAR